MALPRGYHWPQWLSWTVRFGAVIRQTVLKHHAVQDDHKSSKSRRQISCYFWSLESRCWQRIVLLEELNGLPRLHPWCGTFQKFNRAKSKEVGGESAQEFGVKKTVFIETSERQDRERQINTQTDPGLCEAYSGFKSNCGLSTAEQNIYDDPSRLLPALSKNINAPCL